MNKGDAMTKETQNNSVPYIDTRLYFDVVVPRSVHGNL
jgi:hypothetical protein